MPTVSSITAAAPDMRLWTRVAVIFYFAAFVLLVAAPKALLLFGAIDLLSAIWTWLALKKDDARRAPANQKGRSI